MGGGGLVAKQPLDQSRVLIGLCDLGKEGKADLTLVQGPTQDCLCLTLNKI